ncbi:hypothetical protein ABZ904_26115 [Streptomyces sp. NPDC046900]|uniref:hypothetical protein n=1 Tax=Streptomyces sp. NPDC046900 TaxID=3155473 RepID=UPI0033F722BA
MDGYVRLRPGVHVAPVGEGLRITGRGRSRILRGDARTLDRIWQRIFPRLHEGSSPEDLVSPLPATDAEAAGRLLDLFEQLGLLLGQRPVPDRQPFSDVLRYLESCADDPAAALDRFRSLEVFLSGTGDVVLAAGRALLSFGLARLVLVEVPEPVCAELRELATGRGGAEVVVADAIGSDGLVITVDAPAVPRTRAHWLGVARCGQRAVVGPLGRPGSGLTLADLPDAAPHEAEHLSPMVQVLAGNLAALDAFAFGAGLASAHGWRAHVVHTDGLRVERTLVARSDAAPWSGRPDAPVVPGLGVLNAGLEPALLADSGLPMAVAQCELPDGRAGLGFAAPEDEDLAVAAARLDALRRLVPGTPQALWDERSSSHLAAPAEARPVVGSSAEDALRDGIRRLLCDPAMASSLLEPAHRVEPSSLDGSAADLFKALDRFGIPMELEVAAPAAVPAGLRVARVSTYGRLLGTDCAPSADQALAGALGQAALSVTRGADPVPTHAADERWDPSPVIEALREQGHTVLTARWTGAPAPDIDAVLGWITLTTESSNPSADQTRLLPGKKEN